MEYDAPRKALAEFLGTFTLLFAAVASIALGDQVAGVFGVAVAQGLAIGLMVSALGHVSGAHFNPAVTFGFLLTRRIEPLLAVIYWVAQVAGAIAGALVVKALFPNEIDLDRTVPVLSGIDPWQGILLEALLTFFLVFVVFATAVDPKGTFPAIAGFGIGLTITLDILVGGPLTGAAMNPARAFSSQLVQNVWSDAWIYYVAPLVGGGIAALVYDGLYLTGREPAATEERAA
jgi:aquaporin TIP